LATFDGVSPSALSSDTNALDAAIAAMSLAVSGVPADQISILQVTGSESRRLDLSLAYSQSSHLKGSSSAPRHDVSMQAVSSNILYQLNATLEALGFSESSSDDAYSQLTSEISSSIVSGKFQQDLKASGQTSGVNTFTAAEVNKVPDYGAPTLILKVTSPPTSLPTGQPTTPPPTSQPTRHKKGNSADDDGNVGAIAGGVIGGFIGLVIIGVIIYYCTSQQRRNDLEEKFRKHNIMSSKAAQEGGEAGSSSQPQLKSMESIDQVFDKRGSVLPTHTNDVKVSVPDESKSGERRSGKAPTSNEKKSSKIREDHRDRDDFL